MSKIDFAQSFRSNFPLRYVVSEDETQTLLDLQRVFSKRAELHKSKGAKIKIEVHVYNASWGVRSFDDTVREWSLPYDPSTATGGQPVSLARALATFMDEPPAAKGNVSFDASESFLIVLDADHVFDPRFVDPQVIRRIKNHLNRWLRSSYHGKHLIFIGKQEVLPPSIAEHFVVVDSPPLTTEDISTSVKWLSKATKVSPTPSPDLFKSFSLPTIYRLFCRQMSAKEPFAPFDPSLLQEMREEVLKNSGGLVSLVATEESDSFQNLGGLSRFKEWADLMAPAWTPEGAAYGLQPPRGFLSLGVWGCGKSQSVKAVSHRWRVPLLQLEMGRLRSALVGSSEKNLYSALRSIEQFGNCIVWMDDAEKTLSGSSSSSQSDGGVGLRMLGILSTWMQEYRGNVCFAMTANNIQTLPPEFISRLDDRFFFDLPEGKDREDVISSILLRQGIPVEGYSLRLLSDASEGMVPREIAQAVNHAKFLAFARKEPVPSQATLQESFQGKSRILTTMESQIRGLREWVGYDPDRDDGKNARLANPRKNSVSSFFKEV